MQKLLRRSPSGHPILSVNSSLSLPCFFSQGFYSTRNSVKMPSSAAAASLHHALHHRPENPISTAAAKNLKFTKLASNNRPLCRCAIENDSRGIIGRSSAVPSRAWVVLKKSKWSNKTGPRALWFRTLAGNSDKGDEFAVTEAKGMDNLEDGKGAEERQVRVQRRQRNSGVGGGVVVGNPDLLTIPGVGPRNLRKLVEKGFDGVAQLKQLYKDKFFGSSSQKMVEFLQTSVGIIHRNHAESITTFIKDSVDEEMKENSSDSDIKPVQKKRLTFCVEGNISVGKTTFLQRIANETLELRDLVEIVPEPIDKWQNVGPDHFNILDAFYAEPERYAYTFQNYVFVTRVMQERESSGGIKPLRLMERSVFSDRMVFVRAVHEAKWMNEMEISIYDSWFDPVVSSLPGLIPDGFIYLRASPDTCHKRMMLRKRAEEGGVSLEYLQDLHEKHESWLFPFQSGNHGVLSVSKLPQDADWSLHPYIRDRVYYLDGDHMHSSIQKVPALVLDCEPDIDFSRDLEAKQQYARQVAEFFEFVKKKKEVTSSKVGENSATSNQPQVFLPRKGGLLMPGSRHFPESAIKSLDFRRAMSYFSQ